MIDIIENNIKVIQKFVRLGMFPLSTMSDYDIYLFYKSIDYENSPMKKYAIVALRFKVSVTTVRNAVRKMEKPVVL